MVLPVLGFMVAGMAVQAADDADNRSRQEAVALRMMEAEDRYPDGGVDFFHFILQPFPRKNWAGKRWYDVECVLNGFHAVLLCPTLEGLYYVSGGIPHRLRWDEVEDFHFFA